MCVAILRIKQLPLWGVQPHPASCKMITPAGLADCLLMEGWTLIWASICSYLSCKQHYLNWPQACLQYTGQGRLGGLARPQEREEEAQNPWVP